MLIALCIFYIIPVLRLALFFIPPLDIKYLRKVNGVIGRYEWFVHPVRDFVISFVTIFLAWKISYLYAGFTAVSVFSILRYKFHERRIIEFARSNRFIDPKCFFECYYSGFGFIPTKLPGSVTDTIIPSNCSFRSGKRPHLSFLPVLFGTINTHTLAKLIVIAGKWKGPVFAREVSASLCTIWGARTAQLGNFSVKVTGLEKLDGLSGKFIFAFNHKSFLDFAVGPFALSENHSFRFLAARDHFIDNPFLYRVMGRALVAVGTIFVDRKKSKSSPKSASLEAAEKLAGSDIEIAIFPQGTRAFGNVSADGKRLDSGYYTSGSKERLKQIGGHLKKGAAHIAVDTEIALKDLEKSFVHIIPVGIVGTGLASPKRSILLRKETDIVIKIADPMTIKQSDVQNLEIGSSGYVSFVEEIHKTLDERLKTILEIHPTLEQRFFTDVRKIIPPFDYEHFSVTMKAWRGKDYLIFAILDCIYATKPKHWHSFLREFCYLLISDAPTGTLIHFKERVVENMIKGN